MKTFEDLWERCLEDELFYNIDRSAARMVWEAATLAERERCAKLCEGLDLKMSLRGDCSVVDGWERFREEAFNAIRYG